MNNLILVAFLTGLTAGGLSCFAVQGGLLSGSIAQQAEVNTRAMGGARKAAGKTVAIPWTAGMIQPILLFMVAKLVAYTLLGLLLGGVGSAFSFSPALKGLIQLAIGVFLVGNALRMFNVHPIFRYFTFDPPSRLTRYIRRVSKRDTRTITPLFLGALTVLIPCGVTQAMMAVAIGTGSPWLGAVIMFAFVLGTSPTFVGISWLATHLAGLFQKYFYRAVAVVVLLLGLYTLDGGLALVGSPLAVSSWVRASQSEAPAAVTGNVARISVENNGYSPTRLTLPANQPIELHLVTDNTRSCSRAFTIPDLDLMEVLPETGEKVVTLPAQAAGTTMQFMCSMGMYGGFLQFQ